MSLVHLVKSSVIHRIAYLLSFFARLTKIGGLRSFVIDSVWIPYFGWRKLEVVGKTNFGLKMNLSLPDSIQTSIFMTGEWEPAVSKVILSSLTIGDTFIDIGANIGWHTLLGSHIVGPAGKVYSIEASPSIFRKLKGNVDLNSIGNVQLINVAVSNGPGKVSIWTAPEGNLGHSQLLRQWR